MAIDPTYRTEEINENPAWALAFRLSEIDNDNAPLGWSRYIPIARWLIATFELTPRELNSARTEALAEVRGAS